jgi:MtN3 and saliva related transmembrane protein
VVLTAPDLIGAAAALCSMTSFAPQIVKIWREKDAAAVSLKMYLITVAGFGLWVAYGVMIGRWPLIAANLVCLGMAALVLALRIRYAHRSNRPRGA